jgi:hypothetical protein
MSTFARWSVLVASVGAAGYVACGGDSGSPSEFRPDASEGLDATTGDEQIFIPAEDGGSDADAGFAACGDGGCKAGAVCKYGVCIPDLGTCNSNSDCPGDSYCDQDKICVPYGVPPGKVNDESCAKPIAPNGVTPVVQCEWESPPALADGGADPTAAFVSLYTAPMVADLNLDLDSKKLQPSIVVTTWADLGQGRVGMLRVFDGRTCAEQLRIGGPDDPNAADNRPAYGTQWAIGDLDNDVGQTNGHPEIVGLHRVGFTNNNDPLELIAYRIDSTSGTPRLVKKWAGRICEADGGSTQVLITNNLANFGPGIWDLDDDGKPEVVLDENVFDQNGCLLNPPGKHTPYLDHGMMSTVADVDLDGKPDLVRHNGVFGWNTTTKQWERKPWSVDDAALKPGHVAVADLGAYSVIPGKQATDKLPEIIVTSAETSTFNPNSSGTIRVQTLTGQIVFGPIALYKLTQAHGGHGGPPTAADFDGDGQVELAAAANEFYTVYDPDCTADGGATAQRPGGKCNRPATPDGGATPPAGILWAQPSRDFSSSETGSSIFDFDGDGAGEAVYRDECYMRVYKGATGEVIYSAPASSGTGFELPVVVDVDGDFATEIVVPRALNAPNGCPNPDPLFPASGAFVKKGGFAILRDPLDRWASSRPIWNQHAYSVTHVLDDARIPRASQVMRNWEVQGLNNFRQQSQGALGKLALADLTVQVQDLAALCAGQSGTLPLNARVCNRGTNPVQDGATIAFYSTARDAGAFDAGAATLICQTQTATLLNPGQCTNVTCTGTVPANADVYVVADPENKIADCHPRNNSGASARALCPVVK